MNVKKKFIRCCVLMMFSLVSYLHGYSQSSTAQCPGPVITVLPNGSTIVCLLGGSPGSIPPYGYSVTCQNSNVDVIYNDNCFQEVPCCPGGGPLQFSYIVNLTGGGSISCTSMVTLPGCDKEPCDGEDSDGDGVCDEEDCFPNNPNLSPSPGDPCDDGNPNTAGDTYNFDCECVGNTEDVWPCVEDSDGDGVCDEDDCSPYDPSATYGPGTACDDGDSSTVNDQYDENCNCIGVPNNCEGVTPDDGCSLTTDILNADCSVTNIPPNPDDGCPLTLDYFDAATCSIVNLPPDVNDGCEGTYDYFDSYNCEIVHEALPCDDGDPSTVGDKYNDDCECQGCDPCQLEGERWNLLCELLNR